MPAVAEVPYEEIANPEPESALETETDAENMSTAELVSAISAGNLTADDTARIIAGRGDAAINELVKCLSEYRDRDNARAVLAAIGAAAVPGLVGNLNDYRLRSEIEKLMDDLDQEGATALMGELGRIEDRDVLCRILVTVGKLGPPGAQEKIEPFLNSDDYRIKYEAERALRSLGLDYEDIEKIKKAQ